MEEPKELKEGDYVNIPEKADSPDLVLSIMPKNKFKFSSSSSYSKGYYDYNVDIKSRGKWSLDKTQSFVLCIANKCKRITWDTETVDNQNVTIVQDWSRTFLIPTLQDPDKFTYSPLEEFPEKDDDDDERTDLMERAMEFKKERKKQQKVESMKNKHSKTKQSKASTRASTADDDLGSARNPDVRGVNSREGRRDRRRKASAKDNTKQYEEKIQDQEQATASKLVIQTVNLDQDDVDNILVTDAKNNGVNEKGVDAATKSTLRPKTPPKARSPKKQRSRPTVTSPIGALTLTQDETDLLSESEKAFMNKKFLESRIDAAKKQVEETKSAYEKAKSTLSKLKREMKATEVLGSEMLR